MKHRKSSTEPLDRPFQKLGVLLKERRLPSQPPAEKPVPLHLRSRTDPADEDRVFRDAMADVIPLSRNSTSPPCPAPCPDSGKCLSCEPEVIARLDSLVKKGSGFVVSQTPEYMSGEGPGTPPGLTEKLHSGQFAIQAFIDLHGFTVPEAREAFFRFMEEATRLGRRTVLVVHGRGLSSPKHPVLKRQVRHWLSSGPWRKWIMAYCSARLCDGGAGATYVLLRSRPLTKRQQRRK